MKKKRIRLIVALVIIAILIQPIQAIALGLLVKTEECTAEIYQAGYFDLNYDRDYSKYQESGSSYGVSTLDVNMSDIEKTLEDRIYQALLVNQSEIKFYVNEGLSRAWCKTMYTDVINDHPELFYVSQTYSVSYFGNTIISIFPSYTMSNSEIAQAKKVFNAGVDNIMSLLDDSMDDLQKAMVVHDYVCSNAIYKDNGIISHSAWGFFYDGYIVCAGYSLLYSYLMKQAGIECELITSETHGWNTIKINGKWYNVDLTWDDVSIATEPWTQDGGVNHKYFMKSTAFFDNPNTTGYSAHETSDTFDDCERTDTSYDSGAFWEDVDSPIMVRDGNYYYLDPYYSNKYVILKERTKSGTESNYLYNAYDLLATNKFYCNGNDYYNPTTLYCSICMDGNTLIVTCKDGLYRICGKKAVKVCSLTDGYGVGIKNNEIIYFQKAASGYSTVDKATYAKTFFGSNYANGDYAKTIDTNNDGRINSKDFAKLKLYK